MDVAIERLFAEYEKAFNALDIEKNATFFTDSFISAGPNGIITQSKADFLKEAHKASQFYKSIGQSSARMLSTDEIPISVQYSLINVH